MLANFAIAPVAFGPINRVSRKDSRSETLKTLALLRPQAPKRLHQQSKGHVSGLAAIQNRLDNLRRQPMRVCGRDNVLVQR